MRIAALIRSLAAAGAVVLIVGAAAAAPAGGAPAGTARAWAVKVIVPGAPDTGSRVLAAPPDSVFYDGAFAYPADGSVVAATSETTSVSASSDTQTVAGATAQLTALSLFKGEITAVAVTGEAHALATGAGASGDVGVTGLTGLVVLGQPITPTVNQQIPLGDWGYAIALEEKAQQSAAPTPGYHGFVSALDVFVTTAHGGLPAQSEIQIGYAEADAQALAQGPSTTTGPTSTVPLPPVAPHKRKHHGLVPTGNPLHVKPPLLGGGEHVFPVFGESAYGDTYGALRSDVPGGWHHGDDIFAALGTPVLAVAHGTVFSVGWNKVGGWRLWLRDDAGNEFYYAHLSAYSPLAVDGAIVSAGDVLGFVGDTGDAEGTPFHLHFEVHPLGYLALGYDGAVDPTTYLQAWQRVVNIRFDAAAGWLPAQAKNAPPAGAVLLQSSDISTASGLDPASLSRALAAGAVEGGTLASGAGGGQLLPPASSSTSSGGP